MKPDTPDATNLERTERRRDLTAPDFARIGDTTLLHFIFTLMWIGFALFVPIRRARPNRSGGASVGVSDDSGVGTSCTRP